MASRRPDIGELAVGGPPPPALSIDKLAERDSFDDDLAWIISKYIDRTGATDGVLSVHHNDGQPPDLLFAHGKRAGEAELERLVVEQSAHAPGRERRDANLAADWREFTLDGRTLRTMSIPLAADANERLVLTTVHEPGVTLQEDVIEYAAFRLQPVLVGYFKLWLLTRAQRRRIDGLASALNFTDIAIFLLDGAAGLLFTNHVGRDLLDDVDGIRRVGGSLTATDMADAVKLRVAIDHVIGLERATADLVTPAPIVPLRRKGDRRALIASVMPSERRPRTVNDPAVILYVFSPDIQVGLLLAPICQIYGLSPGEIRLVGLLAEGLSVSEAAARMRVKVPTVRTYLKQIFVKTETSRQSDLIRLMMGSLIRTRPGLIHKVV